ncbi:MAG: bifunctional helix-turn-helix transcriptional regulator/GNAT family N-acetyltransferase [Candidatus Dormiibacterota bacterium]
MDSAMVAQVRRFNRVVTQHVGALNERYLARAHSLGEARVLWEIGAEGCDVRSLRDRLGLDSGYLSRLLGALVATGLVTLGSNDSDRRVRTARLTPQGLTERSVLDERSDALAESLLAALLPEQRERLCTAMGEVERLISAATVAIAPIDPSHPRAQQCLRAYFTELNRRFDTGFDPSLSISADDDELRPPAGLLVLARLRGKPIGCGALKFTNGQAADVKRMWVAESARGLGVGRRILTELEQCAATSGVSTLRLETNRTLVEAVGLYRSAGYAEVPAFSDEPYAHHWFEKHIVDASQAT